MPIVGIAGVGLIGGSVGLRARERGWTVRGWDVDPAHLATARERGALDATDVTFDALAASVDTLVLAGPVDATLAQLGALAAGRARPDLVLDVASVKARIARAGADVAGFVATHPIAGSERSGPEAARADLFTGRVWTIDAAASDERADRARSFVEAMGAVPFAIACDEHDRVVALTSHLPQLISVALAARLHARFGDDAVARLSGGGMRSMLRLAASSWPMWREILAENGPLVAQEVRAFADILNLAAGELERGATGDLAARFADAADTVARLHANDVATGVVGRAMTQSDER